MSGQLICTDLLMVTVEKQGFVAGNLLYHSVIVLFLSVVVSMEIYRRHCVLSDPCVCVCVHVYKSLSIILYTHLFLFN